MFLCLTTQKAQQCDEKSKTRERKCDWVKLLMFRPAWVIYSYWTKRVKNAAVGTKLWFICKRLSLESVEMQISTDQLLLSSSTFLWNLPLKKKVTSASQQLCGAVSALFVFVASKQHRWRRDVGGPQWVTLTFLEKKQNLWRNKKKSVKARWAPFHRRGKWLLIHLTRCQTSSSSDFSWA